MIKKYAFFIFLVILSLFLFLKKENKEKKEHKNALIEYKNKKNLGVYTLEEWKKKVKGHYDINPKVFEEGLHEGSAVFLGPFRLELASFKDYFIIYLDNMKLEAASPKNTIFYINTNKNKGSFKRVRNGLYFLQKKKSESIPIEFSLKGKINGKKFLYRDKILKERKNEVLLNNERN